MNQYKKKAYVNGGIIAANILYFLFLEITGSSNDALFMIEHGAMYAPAVIIGRQYYRFLTSVFMHFGIEHLLNNMLILFVLGDNMERALGKVKYLIFYLFCGVGANIVSFCISASDSQMSVSAGASGAIFGVVGGLIYAVIVNKGRLEDLNSRQMIILAAISLYFGFTSTGVDNAAHVGGLVIGIIMAAVLYRKPKPADPEDLW